jgi:carbon-monoxide dehydrogenase medium subunit
MKPGALRYVRATSVGHAIEELVEGGLDAKLIAGGQSLVPMLNLRMVSAERLIDLRHIPGFSAVEELEGAVRYGAGVTHGMIQYRKVPDPSNGLMPKVAQNIAYQAVRNRGTIGGSLSLADPSADWLTTMAALGAVIEWSGPDGPGSCLAEEFVFSAYATQLQPTDVLTSIIIPIVPPEARWGTYKLCRKTGEFAHAMAMVIRVPGFARAFMGATGGSPLQLPHSAGVLAEAAEWSQGLAAELSRAAEADVAESGREFEETHLWQLKTCLARAARSSFGIAEIEVEVA